MECTRSAYLSGILGIGKVFGYWCDFVLEIETKGGLLGMSYLMPLRGGLHTLDACMKELIAPHVIGRDATEIEAIWQTLYKSNFWLGRMGVTVFAQSAVDMALWDIVGKRAGLP